MFVIVDLEWIAKKKNNAIPTQIAAIRVDSQWNEQASFSAFICPYFNSDYDESRVEFNGGTEIDFLTARTPSKVFGSFLSWLKHDDVLLWWHKDAIYAYQRFLQRFLQIINTHKSMAISEYVAAFLKGFSYANSNPYIIAKQLNLSIQQNKSHYAPYDVFVINEVMKTLEYEQSKLLMPIDSEYVYSTENPSVENLDTGLNEKYIYNIVANTIHQNGCPAIGDNKTALKGYATLNTAIRKKFKACSCCEDDYYQALRSRNLDTISRMTFNYIYSPESNVFHKKDCGLILKAYKILGTHSYEGAMNIGTGKRPCKVCKPKYNKTVKNKAIKKSISKTPKKVTTTNIVKKFERKPAPDENTKAVNRQKFAAKERERRLSDNFTETEKQDVYTLTQPSFIFFAAKGYKNFHLYSCPALQHLSDFQGFATFNEAKSAGYTPCRKCKPTDKHNLTTSVPINNEVRTNERMEDVINLCKEAEFEYTTNNDILEITTPVGKWKVHIKSRPVQLEHINLVLTPNNQIYHEQPRVFLSLTDAVTYIKQHDKNLMRQQETQQIWRKNKFKKLRY